MSNGFLNDLVAYWDMEGTSAPRDRVNNWGLSGVTGSPASVTGKDGNARDFNSANVCVYDAVGRAALNLRQNPMVDFTISLWIKFNSAPQTSGGTWIWEEWDAAGNEGWAFVARGQADPDNWGFSMRHAGGILTCLSADENINAGQWYHCVLRYDAAAEEMALFIDSAKTTADATGLQVETAGDVRWSIGGWIANGVQYADAVIDEFALWDRVLTDAEIEHLYDSEVYYDDFDSDTFNAGTASAEDSPNHDNANDGPLFNRVMEVYDHLQANPLDTGDAAITVMYRQVPL